MRRGVARPADAPPFRATLFTSHITECATVGASVCSRMDASAAATAPESSS